MFCHSSFHLIRFPFHLVSGRVPVTSRLSLSINYDMSYMTFYNTGGCNRYGAKKNPLLSERVLCLALGVWSDSRRRDSQGILDCLCPVAVETEDQLGKQFFFSLSPTKRAAEGLIVSVATLAHNGSGGEGGFGGFGGFAVFGGGCFHRGKDYQRLLVTASTKCGTIEKKNREGGGRTRPEPEERQTASRHRGMS